MKHLLFYITGHGYGHFVRTFDVIKHILAKRADIVCHVKTTAPVWLTRHKNIENIFFYHESVDVGAVQDNSFSVNIEATLKAYADLIDQKEALFQREIEFIAEKKIQLVVGDIPPFAFDVAKFANIPGIAFGNFSWDWIYEPYTREFPKYEFIIEKIKQSYAHADLLLRLPMAGDMSAFPRIENIPLIAQRSIQTRENILVKLGVNPASNKKIILLALRNHDLARMDLNLWKKHENFLFIIPDSKFDLDKNILTIPADFCLFEDLIKASDLVVSKPGYGIVSGCIANRTPLLYTSRDDFVEYEVLHFYILKNMPGIFVPREDFMNGKWVDYIKFEKLPEKGWSKTSIDGAQKSAERVVGVLENA